jgi:KDO2-lipid IV(A) lauroyltransferase
MEPALMRVLMLFGSRLPRRLGWAAAGLAGTVAARVPGRSNRFMSRNIRLVAEPLGLSPDPASVYRHMAGGMLDFLHLSSRGDEVFRRVVRVEGREHLDRVMAQGRGAVVVTAHYSSWELIPRAVTLMGHRVGIVGRKLWNPRVSRELDRLRGRFGVETIDRGRGAAKLMRALRGNTAVGILIDQETRAVEGSFVPFLGVPALTPTGPASICLRFGVPAVTLHIRRVGMEYILTVDPPVDTREFQGPGGAEALTGVFNGRIGEWIVEEPEQWIWFHDRWGRSPAFRAVVR